jgi:flagellar hook-basal body complex protein FliE
MTIAPIAAIAALPSVASVGTAATAPAATNSFSSLLSNAVNDLQQAQTTASSDEAQAAAGQGNLADMMIAASQASLDTQVTTDLLNKAVSSFTSIMQMTF